MAEEPLSGVGVIVTSVRPDSRGYETPGKGGEPRNLRLTQIRNNQRRTIPPRSRRLNDSSREHLIP
jgi:hypothetical protein